MMYVDDILAISMDAKSVLEILKSENIKFKNNKIEVPEMYLGAKLQLKELNGYKIWAIGSVDCLNAAIKTVEGTIRRDDGGCRPEQRHQ